VVIENGRIEEKGTHEELLMIPDGIYKKLYEMQTF
jgi:ABC-type multidrug transport system fused ATPase/permease subunit